MDAASVRFLQDGYAGTHMAKVAEEAQVSLATLYRYFESKDELLDQAFRREVDRIEAPIRGSWPDPPDPELLLPYATTLYQYTLAWAQSDTALGLLLTMAESPGLLYRFFLDRVEVYEYWTKHTVARLVPDPEWLGMHSVVAASGFYALMMRWGRGRLGRQRPQVRRRVPEVVPDAGRQHHVADTVDFTATELSEWYILMRLRALGLERTVIQGVVKEARAVGWQPQPA
jgi:AcrR family transcriptional regulator